MPKQLLILRHAKSSWSNSLITDYQRPLNKRGLKIAPKMGRFIHQQGLTPNWIVSSSATRAKMTAELFVENCVGVNEEQLIFTDDFYHAPATVYLDYLTNFSNRSVDILMFVGHNPGMEDLVERLSGDWESMPTAAVAHFELEVDDWSEFGSSVKAQMKNVWRPKEIDLD